jgi:hypothetical protein
VEKPSYGQYSYNLMLTTTCMGRQKVRKKGVVVGPCHERLCFDLTKDEFNSVHLYQDSLFKIFFQTAHQLCYASHHITCRYKNELCFKYLTGREVHFI